MSTERLVVVLSLKLIGNTGDNIMKKQSKAAIIRKVNLLGYEVGSLLSVGVDSKTIKGQKFGYLTGVLYMMPNDQICPMSEIAGCRTPCLVSAGRAAFMPGIGRARAERTRLFEENRDLFFEWLCAEIDAMIKKAERKGMIPVLRLNGTSDINWMNVVYKDGETIFDKYSHIQFYDYTKRPNIMRAAAGVDNWHITASYSEANEKYRDLIVAAANKYGVNLAVVFSKKLFPIMWMGKTVENGDESDLRFLDKKGVIVGLSAKGKARKDSSGFVITA